MAESERQQQFEVYRRRPTGPAQDDDGKFWLILVLIAVIGIGVVGALFASRKSDDADKPPQVPSNAANTGPADPAPQSVFDRLDWIQDQEGPASALALAEEKYLVEYPNAPNLVERIKALRALTTTGQDEVVRELREDARRQVAAGQLEDGMSTIEQILERTNGQDPEAHFLKAKALLQGGDNFGAESALEEAAYQGYNAGEIEELRRQMGQ
ncbi:MAG: hypothetical protein KDD82_28240 [Planctomycetes bacterium]|nr:hypothetical protein [Planctomycetota bacterium]